MTIGQLAARSAARRAHNASSASLVTADVGAHDVALERTLELSLQAQPGDASVLASAVALALAVIELNHPALTFP